MKVSGVVFWLLKPRNLWVAIFIYTVVMGLFVQLLFLPYIVPSWHAGDGLLKGVDGPKFHKIALSLSETMKSDGWKNWNLTPRGQLVSGMAAIFYVLIYPAPWSLLPLNAILNASACVCLYLTLAGFMQDRKVGFISALPFMFFPSALLWNTQLHNENYAVPGVALILFGWMILLTEHEKTKFIPISQTAMAVLPIGLGSLLLGLVRDYILTGMSFLFMAVSGGFIVHWLVAWAKTGVYSGKLLLVSMGCAVMLMVGYGLDAKGVFMGDLNAAASTSSKKNSASDQWIDSVWLPKVIDSQFKDLARYRNEFVELWGHGGSGIDLDVTFNSASDMILYVPRSLQIGFLSPFPDIWFSEGKKAAGSGMRAVSAIETIIAYFCLLMLPFFIWTHRKQPAVLVITFVCAAMIIVYAMIVPNQGALYRFRYPYFMPLVGLGLSGWLEVLNGGRIA